MLLEAVSVNKIFQIHKIDLFVIIHTIYSPSKLSSYWLVRRLLLMMIKLQFQICFYSLKI
jgi:hypothetical protein